MMQGPWPRAAPGLMLRTLMKGRSRRRDECTLDEAHILIKLFPPTALYGIEWTLLHLIESVYSEIKSLEYRELINECNSTEFKKMLVQRLNNSQQKKITNEAG